MTTPVVFIHGWASVPEVWGALIASLATDNIINVALPGYQDEVGDDVWLDPAAVLLQQLPERCHLVGWSLGGNLAMAMAEQAPERVASVCTIATVPSFVASESWPWAMVSDTFGTFLNGFREAPIATLKRFAALQAKGDQNARQIAKALNALANTSKLPVLERSLQWLGETQQNQLWQQCKIPHLALFGELDAIVPASAAAHCQRGQVIPRCGHAPMMSQPEWVAQTLTDFWASL